MRLFLAVLFALSSNFAIAEEIERKVTVDTLLELAEKCSGTPCEGLVEATEVEHNGQTVQGATVNLPDGPVTYFVTQAVDRTDWYLCKVKNYVEINNMECEYIGST